MIEYSVREKILGQWFPVPRSLHRYSSNHDYRIENQPQAAEGQVKQLQGKPILIDRCSGEHLVLYVKSNDEKLSKQAWTRSECCVC